MIKIKNPEIQNSFKALADPTRRQILVHLSEREMTIAEITERFLMTRAAIKKHLTILQNGQLIKVKRQGRERLNSLNTEGLQSVSDWMSYFDQFWDSKLNRLQNAIKQTNN